MHTDEKDNSFSWRLGSFDAVRIHAIDDRTDKIGIKNRADVEQVEYHCDTQKLQAAQSSHDFDSISRMLLGKYLGLFFELISPCRLTAWYR